MIDTDAVKRAVAVWRDLNAVERSAFGTIIDFIGENEREPEPAKRGRPKGAPNKRGKKADAANGAAAAAARPRPEPKPHNGEATA